MLQCQQKVRLVCQFQGRMHSISGIMLNFKTPNFDTVFLLGTKRFLSVGHNGSFMNGY